MRPRDLAVLVVGLGVLGVLFFMGDAIAGGVQVLSGDAIFNRWDGLFKSYGARFGVPWRWLKVICLNESSNGQNKRVLAGLANPSDIETSKSSDGKSWGLMQITLATAKGLLGRGVSAVELNNPDLSVELSARLLRELIDRFSLDDKESVFRAYNGGPAFGAATYPYWVKTQAHLALVMQGNPGNELET